MHPIIEAIEERRTVNLFDPTRGLSDESINELVRLATKAPSSFNLQNWRFIAVRTPEAKARLRTIGWDQPKITDAAVTFVVVGKPADHELVADRLRPAVDAGIMPAAVAAAWEGGAKALYFEQPQRQRDEAVRSATFGASTLMFAAHAMGLASGPMSGFDVEAVAEEFELAADEFPVMLLAVGFAAPDNWRQKPRRELSQVLRLV
ncbi:nitroreductase family protein [Streptosporangium sp. NPDC002721]|uniref:nitroreductase family protein n=1 Tax=Streptosporangium sp. NPDC002721 TaxID=3366188 RepID=UPI0036B6F615